MELKSTAKNTIITAEKAALNQASLKIKSITIIWSAFIFILKRPSYWKYIILSILVNITVFFGTITLLVVGFSSLLLKIQDWTSFDLNTGFDVLLIVLFVIVAVYLTVLIFTTVSSIFNSPIYDALTDRILEEYNVENLKPYYGYLDFAVTTYNSLKFEIKKLIVSLTFFIFTLILNAIPAVGNGIFVVTKYMNIIIMNGLDIMDPALTRNHVRFRSKVRFIIENPALWPYLIIAGTLNGIPVVNIFTIPLTIVSATMLYVEVLKLKNLNR